jgi:hypothetical protein
MPGGRSFRRRQAGAAGVSVIEAEHPPLSPLRGGEHAGGYRQLIILLDTVRWDGYSGRVNYELKRNGAHRAPLQRTDSGGTSGEEGA